jgi:NAD-dependent DNA ligase
MATFDRNSRPTAEKDAAFLNRVGGKRIADRQIDEMIGLARGLIADGRIDQSEVEFLQKWLAANMALTEQPLIRTLYARITEVLKDGLVDTEEKAELMDTLCRFTTRDMELGEVLKSTSLPLCDPMPTLNFEGWRYCFTGTFNYGKRKDCEDAVTSRGAIAGSLSQKTKVLVIGIYATEAWKHSTYGNKIIEACDWRDAGIPISIVSEEHWVKALR